MRSQVIEKLDRVLINFNSEPDVVYILTRIGKILEFDYKKSDYPTIMFYRNWSVHSKINDTRYVDKYLKDFINNREKRDNLLFHKSLIDELSMFVENYGLSQFTNEQVSKFIYLLGQVISDTSVFIQIENTRYEVSISDPIGPEESGAYKISVTARVKPIKLEFKIPTVSSNFTEN